MRAASLPVSRRHDGRACFSHILFSKTPEMNVPKQAHRYCTAAHCAGQNSRQSTAGIDPCTHAKTPQTVCGVFYLQLTCGFCVHDLHRMLLCRQFLLPTVSGSVWMRRMNRLSMRRSCTPRTSTSSSLYEKCSPASGICPRTSSAQPPTEL